MDNFNILITPFLESKYRITRSWSTPLSLGENGLMQIGMTFFNESTHIRPHTHSFANLYELTVVIEGEGYVIINNTPISVKENDICLIMPLDKHEIVSSETKLLKICNIAFVVSGNSTRQAFNEISLNFHSPDMRAFTDSVVFYLLGLILNEVNTDEDLNTDLISSLLSSLIGYIIKNFNKKSTKKPVLSVYDNEILCYQIMNYIDTNCLSIKGLTEVSDFTGYTYPYISSLFKKTTKMTLMEYYTNARFKKAIALLADEHLSVGKVSEMLNYSSSNAFTKAFKNKYGVPPTKIKKIACNC